MPDAPSPLPERLRKAIGLCHGDDAVILEAASAIELLERLDSQHKSERRELLTKLDAALAKLREATEWRDIGTAPRDGTPILAATSELNDGFQQVVSWIANEECPFHSWATSDGICYADSRFTHWLPLPLAPDAQP